MKARKGYVFQVKNGIWYARFTDTDNSGKHRNVKRCANNKSHSSEILKQLINEFDNGGAEQLDAAAYYL